MINFSYFNWKVWFGILILIVGIFIRTWHLQIIPVSLYLDEIDHVVTGLTLYRFGTDLSGTWKLWELQPFVSTNVVAELPALFFLLVQRIFGGTAASTAHVVNTVFGLGTVIIAIFIAQELFKNWKLALTSGLMLLVNPWHIFISRMAFESALSVFFQLMFVLGFLKIFGNKKRTMPQYILISILLVVGYFFGYLTYHGAKFTLLALALVFIALLWIVKVISLKEKIYFSLLISITASLLLFSTLMNLSTSRFSVRSSELLVSFSYLQAESTSQRMATIDNPLTRFIINKPTVLLHQIFLHYVSIFDPYRLFFTGQETAWQFSLVVSGYFYIIQLPFIAIGFFWLVCNWKRDYLPFVLLFVVSPFASAISVSFQSVFRAALTYVLLNLISGIGLWYLIFEWKNPLRKLGLFLIITMLGVEIMFFGYHYFFDFPLTTITNYDFDQRLLASYVSRIDRPVTIISDHKAYNTARALLTYTGLIGELSLDDLLQFSEVNKSVYQLPGMTISDDCLDLASIENTNVIISAGQMRECDYYVELATDLGEKPSTESGMLYKTLSSPKDSGSYYYLIKDELCEIDSAPTIVRLKKLDDLYLEKQNNQDFCSTWVKQEYKLTQ